MIEKIISRRQMIKGSSLAALSTVISSTLVNAQELNTDSNEINFDIPASSSDICFMNAVDMAALLRAKKLSAREVMQTHLK